MVSLVLADYRAHPLLLRVLYQIHLFYHLQAINLMMRMLLLTQVIYGFGQVQHGIILDSLLEQAVIADSLAIQDQE